MVSEEDGIRLGISLLQKNIDRVNSELRGRLSDGYHTFDELYEHRIALFIALCKATRYQVWKTHVHSDGTVMDGHFILGLGVDAGRQITYHLPNSKWDEIACDELEEAPTFDGHTPADVLERLKLL